MQNELQLPPDLLQFLREGRELEYDAAQCECGQVKLIDVDKLKLETIWVEPDECNNADPHAEDEGLYRVQAVDLTKAAEHYSPEFILLWLPDMGCFGTWDGDHYRLIVFPDAAWPDIASNPLPYLSSQWDLKLCGVGAAAPVWTTYPFIPGRPDRQL